jgi:hypothetical protein
MLVLAVSGCGPKKYSDRTFSPRATTFLPDGTEVSTTSTRGGVRADLDPNATTAQLIKLTSGELSGVTIAFPVGSLSIPVSVTVTPGAAVNGSLMMGNLNMSSNSVTASGTPVEVSVNKSIDLKNPMVLSLPIPRGTSLTGAAVDRNRLAVIYRVKVAEGSETGSFTGIVPATDLGWDDGQVLFSTKFFGWYAVVELQTPATAAVQVKARYADQVSAMRYMTLSDLPACTSADIDRLAYVAAEDLLYYCSSSGTWVALPDDDMGDIEQPIRIVKDSTGEVWGRVLSAGNPWRVLLEDPAGGLDFLVELNLDTANPAVGIVANDYWPAPTMGLYFFGGTCALNGYLSGSAVKWAKKIYYYQSDVTNTSMTLGFYLGETETTNTFTSGTDSYYMTSTCNSTFTTQTNITAVELVPYADPYSILTFSEPWHLE